MDSNLFAVDLAKTNYCKFGTVKHGGGSVLISISNWRSQSLEALAGVFFFFPHDNGLKDTAKKGKSHQSIKEKKKIELGPGKVCL